MNAPTTPPPEESRLDPARMPAHVAIIMDGNGRWARGRGLSRIRGHWAGVESIREVVRAGMSTNSASPVRAVGSAATRPTTRAQ